MSNEEQATLEATEAEAQAEATDEEPTEETKAAQGAKAEESDEDSKQLKAELERERAASKKAQEAAADYAFKLREKQRKEPEVEEEEKPLTSKELMAILAREREATQKEMHAKETDRIAATMSGSETEKLLLLEIHKNRSFPAHLSLEEQIEECHLIANKKKYLGENNELKRALRARQGVSKDASGTHQEAPTGNQPKLGKGEAAVLAQTGFTYNATAKRYEKKFKNGDILVHDVKTKMNTLVKA